MKLLSRFANEYLAPVALSGKNRTTTLCREADESSIEQDRAVHRWRQPPRDRQDIGLRDRLQAPSRGVPGPRRPRARILLHCVIEDQEFITLRPLIDWLNYNGYTVVTKATKE